MNNKISLILREVINGTFSFYDDSFSKIKRIFLNINQKNTEKKKN